jgi:hypothetical protein
MGANIIFSMGYTGVGGKQCISTGTGNVTSEKTTSAKVKYNTIGTEAISKR